MLQHSVSYNTVHKRKLNNLCRTAGSGNLLLSRLTEFMGAYLQLPRQVSLAQDLNPTLYAVDKTGVGQLLDVDRGAVLEPLQLTYIDDLTACSELAVVKSTFRQTPEQRHLSAFVHRDRNRAGPAAGALVPPAASFTLTAAGPPANTATTPVSTHLGSYFMIKH